MKTMFKKYLWLWEFIGVAFILAVGLLAKLVPNILIVIVGIAFIVFGLFRIIPLVRTTGDKVLKWIYSIEILFSIIAGIALIILFINDKNVNKTFGYLIGGVLYMRALTFFYATSLREEESDFLQYLIHIILITLGTIIIARGGFNTSDLGWVILIFAILSATFIAFSGFNNYRNYRNEKVARQITKKVKPVEITAPTADEIKKPNPEISENDQDEINI